AVGRDRRCLDRVEAQIVVGVQAPGFVMSLLSYHRCHLEFDVVPALRRDPYSQVKMVKASCRSSLRQIRPCGYGSRRSPGRRGEGVDPASLSPIPPSSRSSPSISAGSSITTRPPLMSTVGTTALENGSSSVLPEGGAISMMSPAPKLWMAMTRPSGSPEVVSA